jgi:hypothetical protein
MLCLALRAVLRIQQLAGFHFKATPTAASTNRGVVAGNVEKERCFGDLALDAEEVSQLPIVGVCP